MYLEIPALISNCNSLYFWSSKICSSSFTKNSVVRIVTRTFRSSHITPILKSLHCLPVKNCTNFKLCCKIHSALLSGELHYLNSLLILT